MKRLLVASLLAIALVGISGSPANAAKAGYCKVALTNCLQECSDLFSWNGGMHTGCSTGCNIGYLFC